MGRQVKSLFQLQANNFHSGRGRLAQGETVRFIKFLSLPDRGPKHAICQVFFKRDVFRNMLDTEFSKNVGYLATSKPEFKMTIFDHATSEQKGRVA